MEHLDEAVQEDISVDRVEQNERVLENWDIVDEVLLLDEEVFENEVVARLFLIEFLELGVVESRVEIEALSLNLENMRSQL